MYSLSISTVFVFCVRREWWAFDGKVFFYVIVFAKLEIKYKKRFQRVWYE